MDVLIIYDTVHGNTEQLARAMARALEQGAEVRLARVEEMARLDPDGADLVIVGGPTHKHGMSVRINDAFKASGRGALQGKKAGAFDTRYRMPAWLSGSAARGIASNLSKLGARLIAPPESFFIERDLPPEGTKRRHELERLESGELERAAKWAASLLA